MEFYSNPWLDAILRQAEIMLVCFYAWYSVKNNDIKAKTIFSVLTIYYGIILITDWAIPYLPDYCFFLENLYNPFYWLFHPQ